MLTPSDTLAIVTFIRKLGVSLVSKTPELCRLREIHARLQDILNHADIVPGSNVMRQSIRREEELMEHTLSFIDNPVPLVLTSTDAMVGEFLGRMETLPTRKYSSFIHQVKKSIKNILQLSQLKK